MIISPSAPNLEPLSPQSSPPPPALSPLPKTTRERTSSIPDSPQVTTRLAPYDSEYKLKQYGTNVLLTGGAITAGVFIFAPEPVITKIIGGSIALTCITAGGMGKHYLYRNAYLNRAMEKSLQELNTGIDTLQTEINILAATSKKLSETNQDLQQTKLALQKEVTALQHEVKKLDTEIGQAFEQLNADRKAFEAERAAKVAQLDREIEQADTRGAQTQEKLEQLDQRESALRALGDELSERRELILESEQNIRSMQNQLLALLAEAPASAERTETRTTATSTEPAMNPTLQHNLDIFTSLPNFPKAKIRLNSSGQFVIQQHGFFQQSIPRTFEANVSVTNRATFFRPVFKFFNQAKFHFSQSEIQTAFDGLCSLRKTYKGSPAKIQILNNLLATLISDNPNLVDPIQPSQGNSYR